MFVRVAPPLQPYVDQALTRLAYLYPRVKFAAVPGGILIEEERAVEVNELARNVHYALYREKIYAETLPLRRALVEAVAGK